MHSAVTQRVLSTFYLFLGLILSLESEFSDDVKEMSSAIRAISKDWQGF